MPASAPMKTSDGRFGYEAAGNPASPPLVFLHGIGGAARAWRGQLEFFGDRYRAIAWDMPGYGGSAPLASRQHCDARGRAAGFPARGRRDQARPGRAFDRRHDRSAMAGEAPRCRGRRRAGADQPGVRQGRRRLAERIHRRAARPARSRRNHGFAGADSGEGIGRRRSRCPAEWSLRATAWPPFPRRAIAPACWRCWDSTSATRSRISRCRRWCCRAQRTRMRRRR